MATPAQIFKKLSRYPLGRQLFSMVVTRRAPYFASISPLFLELKSGRALVFIKNRRKVHNHIGTVNAIAMCAMCELAAGTMIDSSIPKGVRWIPRGMTVRYLKKAETDLTATVELAQPIAENFQGDIVVPARVRDTGNNVVMEADITMYLSPKKS